MYYKIENSNCEVYKNLFALRVKEHEIQVSNRKLIDEKVGLKWSSYLGHSGQQNFRRVTQYDGFQFEEPEKVDLKIWKRDLEHNEIFVSNRRTKLGREMDEFLANGLKASFYKIVFDILGIEHKRKFTLPFVDIADKGVIIIYLDENHEPKDENVIEITKKEFETLYDSIN